MSKCPYKLTSLDQAIDLVKRLPQHCDSAPHLDYMLKAAAGCKVIVELGSRYGICDDGTFHKPGTYYVGGSVLSFLAAKPNQLYLIDNNPKTSIDHLLHLVPEGTDVSFIHGDSCEVSHACDLLFIDTYHSFLGLYRELKHWHPHVRRRILLHDTHKFRYEDWKQKAGMLGAIEWLLFEFPEWKVVDDIRTGVGIMLLERS